jgi:hypothetical protein
MFIGNSIGWREIALYTEKVRDHYAQPRNAGSIEIRPARQ